MDIKRSVLPNGLRLITIPMASLESVSCAVFVGVGSRYEKKDKLGISHVLEHMAFKGTTKRPKPLDIATLVEGIGGEWNAFTSNEMTGFWIKSAYEHTDLSLDVLSDILIHPVLDEKELTKEIGVIKEEAKMYRDSPGRHVLEMVEEQVFGDQPIGWNIIGTSNSLNSITRTDVSNFMTSFYKAPNMVVVLAGKVNYETEASVRSFFGKLKSGKTPGYLAAKTIQTKPSVKIDNRKTEQANLAIGVESVSRSDQDYYPFQVMDAILGRGMSSRLFSSVREQQGLAYHVRSSGEGYHDTGIMIIYAGVDLGKVDQAIGAIMKEITKMIKEKVSAAELSKARELLKGRLKLEMEDTMNVAQIFGLQELLEKHVLTIEEISNLIDRVTEEDVFRVAKRIFKTDKLNLSLIGPFKDSTKFLSLLKV